MRKRTATWKECIVQYEKTTEDGTQKKVKETYVVDGISFTEAEARITNEMQSYISGEFDVVNINPAPYKKIFFSEEDTADKWYQARLAFITIDERTGKEKFSYFYYLVQASSFENARRNIVKVMDTTMIDYVIKSVKETKIIDVFEHTSVTS